MAGGTRTQQRRSMALRLATMATLLVSLVGLKPAVNAIPVAHAQNQPSTPTPTNLPVSFSVPQGSPCAVAGNGSTNPDGTTSATVTITGVGTCQIMAAQPGTTRFNPADSVTQSFVIHPATTHLSLGSITGSATYHDPFPLSATVSPTTVLAKTLAGSVTFSIDGHAVGSPAPVNPVSGIATASPVITQTPGSHHTVTAAFTSSSSYFANSQTLTGSNLSVSKEDTTVGVTGVIQFAAGSSPIVSALLKEDGTTPISGKSVQITIGSGPNARSCYGISQATGMASCQVGPLAFPVGNIPISASFNGSSDPNYLSSSSSSQQGIIYSYLPQSMGAFTLGDLTAQRDAGTPSLATYWSGKWASVNQLSGGAAPPTFFGLAKSLSSYPPVCGSTWTSTIPQSLVPPKNLPIDTGVIVSSHITRTGTTITGNVVGIAVVQPKSVLGTGTVVATFCPVIGSGILATTRSIAARIQPAGQRSVHGTTNRVGTSCAGPQRPKGTTGGRGDLRPPARHPRVTGVTKAGERRSPLRMRPEREACARGGYGTGHRGALLHFPSLHGQTSHHLYPWQRAWHGLHVFKDNTSKQDQSIQFGTISDHHYGDSPFQISAESIVGPLIPPDPATLAPPQDPTVPTDLFTATSFLYSGPNPIQTGVAPGTIIARREAILRGRVLTTAGAGLPGVTVSVLDHPEYGRTISRDDGRYDLAVNGGQPLTVNFVLDGYIPAQRQVLAPWRDYANVDDVALTPFDSVVKDITFSSTTSSFQVAQGSQETDPRGTRQASLLVQPGTTAQMVMPDGSTQPVTDAHLRLTEFTIGSNNMTAMPANLPPTSAYTYCVEVSSDEAAVAGASLTFSKPTFVYLQNFLGVPIGTPVPVGGYDSSQGVWSSQENGLAVKLLDDNGPNGEADLQVDGSGNPATDAQYQALGISDAERLQLGGMYAPGTSLWRASLPPGATPSGPFRRNIGPGFGPPFTAPMPIDFNFGTRSEDISNDDALNYDTLTRILATHGMPDAAAFINKAKDDSLGTLDQQDQTFGEDQSITGTSYRLHYSSDRQSDYTAGYTLPIPLIGPVVPNGLQEVFLRVDVAGRLFQYAFGPGANLLYNFTWDGKDAYGRQLQGPQPVQIEIDHEYPPGYDVNTNYTRGFGQYSGVVYEGHLILTLGCALAGVGAGGPGGCEPPVIVSQFFHDQIGTLGAKPAGLGGWDLDIHNTYDPNTGILYFGDGSVESAKSIGNIITQFAGSGGPDGGDGGPASAAGLYAGPTAVGADGSVYVYDWNEHTIRKIAPDGTITTIAGQGPRGGDPACATDWFGDGCPAIDASLGNISGLAIGPDGSLYLTEYNLGMVRKITPDGVINAIAGHTCGNGNPCGTYYTTGTEVPALSNELLLPKGITVAPDGSVYVAETGTDRVTRISTDGYMSTTVGGAGSCGYRCEGPDNVAAFDTHIYDPIDVAMGPDGSLYILSCGGTDVKKVDPGGIITTLTQQCTDGIPAADGQPATGGGAARGSHIAVDAQGNVFFTTLIQTGGPICFNRIYEITSGGLSYVYAGRKSPENGCAVGGFGGPATRAVLNAAESIALAPDGTLYYATDQFISKIAPPLTGFGHGDIIIPSPDGSQLYRFDFTGRHLQTLNALTGSVMLTFGYDPNTEELTSVTDANGNVTTINHDTAGNPTSIVSPYGDVTTLTTDQNGYLAAVADPLHHAITYAYSPGGLLEAETGPNGHTFTFSYDAAGRILHTAEPTGGTTTLSMDQAQIFTDGSAFADTAVHTTSAVGRSATYDERNNSTLTVNTLTLPDGLTAKQTFASDGTLTDTDSTGMVSSRVLAPDPRFGMNAPYRGTATYASPGGLTTSAGQSVTTTLNDPNNPLSLQSLTSATTINGNQWISTYTAATRTTVSTSPLGRQSTRTLDSQGRVSSGQSGTLAPYSLTYDSFGRPSTVTAGTGGGARTTSYAYDAQGRLSTVTDPLGRVVTYGYDTSDHLTSEVLPGLGTMHFGYDPDGNRTTITTPSGRTFTSGYNGRDALSTFTPPSVNGDDPTIHVTYNADRQPTGMSRSDGQNVGLTYDPGSGLWTSTTLPEGTIAYTHDAATGNLTGITAPGGVSTSLTYDGSLPLTTSWSGPLQGSTGTTYDNFFRAASESVDGAGTVNYGYDNDGLLTSAGALTVGRDAANGLVTGTALGNVTGTRTYNDFGELTGEQEGMTGDTLYSVSYSRDGLGRITGKTESIGGVTHAYTYSYDPQSGRLIGAQKDSATVESYSYDADGNRLTGPGVSTNATYDARGELTQYGSAHYTYNVGEQLATKTDGSGTTTYSYDPLGWLLGVTLPGNKTVSYVLDGQGNRIGKKVNGTLTQGYLYDQGDELVGLLDGNSNLLAQYVYAGGLSPSYLTAGGSTYRIISDQTGSPRLVVDASSGQIMEEIDYDAFGNRAVSNVANGWNTALMPFGFAGGLYDPDTGLDHLGLRDYDPHAGRWTTADPLGIGAGDGATLYGYAYGDPVNLSDPSGAGVYIDPHGGVHKSDPLDPQTLNALPDYAGGGHSFQQDVNGFVANHPYVAGTILAVGIVTAGVAVVGAGSALAAANAATPTLTGLGALNAADAAAVASSTAAADATVAAGAPIVADAAAAGGSGVAASSGISASTSALADASYTSGLAASNGATVVTQVTTNASQAYSFANGTGVVVTQSTGANALSSALYNTLTQIAGHL